MTPAYDQIRKVLLGYLSTMNAEGLLTRALREAEIDPARFTLDDLGVLLPSIERRARLYVEPARLPRLKADLTALGGERLAFHSKILPIRHEADISTARVTAKDVCDGAGARSFVSHKVATAISELARNIVHYTPGGSIEMILRRDPPARFIVVALDQGAGITNLTEVLAGRYRSKTGLGRGLLGVKRLADRFHIDSGPQGTRIEIEVHL
ncbi:ATP-binding protein [Chondromyces crocatus]|uniref:Protein kinase n=1 Tax=Chondromyces crocatus TaxID=52 RepID=A0A0K1EJP3_CHOCO|nr:ATP-binding protein [Chondromyces crocatus]AKT40823.1 protein kinase [Chondromyces crocatus]